MTRPVPEVARPHGTGLADGPAAGRRRFTIGEAAARCGLTEHTLRWYERIGLLPEVGRSRAGQRSYTERDLYWLNFLSKLRLTGMPVADMIRYTDLVRAGSHTAPQRRALLEQARVSVRRQIADLRDALTMLDYKIATYSGAVDPADLERMGMMASVRRLPAVPLGTGGPQAGLQGLGCMGISEFYGATDPAEARAVLDAALDLGVTMFDSADVYGDGKNEEFLGPFLRAHRDQVLVATKFGLVRNPGPGGRHVDNTPAYARAAVEASLRRLGVDVIDLYYAHRRDPQVPVEEMMTALGGLVTAGKVRFLGLSEVTGEELRRAHAVHPVTAIQSEWSLLSRDVERTAVPAAAELGIAFVAYSPLGRGFLAGAFTDATQLGPGDFRRHQPRYNGPNAGRNAALLAPVHAIAHDRAITPAQVALAWAHQRASVHGLTVVPIPGTRRRTRLAENVAAASIRLSPAELAALEPLASEVAGDRYPDMSTTSAARE
jgi:aryl-alcohol dehydrogenase-like predicted oxidoreductase/DNA-binding transcriptional MerR regulator